MEPRIKGLRELRANIDDLTAAVTNSRTIPVNSRQAILSQAQASLVSGIRGAAKVVSDQTRAIAQSKGWPKQVIDSIFTWGDPTGKTGVARTTALSGVSKRRTMLTWTAKDQSQSLKRVLEGGIRKVSPGGKVSMSLAAMFELGTSRMPARPAFRPAVTITRAAVRAKLVQTYESVIRQFDVS